MVDESAYTAVYSFVVQVRISVLKSSFLRYVSHRGMDSRKAPPGNASDKSRRKEIVIGKLFEETDLNVSRDKKQIANSEGISPHQKLDEQAVIPAKPVYPGILPSEEPTHSEWKRGVRSSLHGIHRVPSACSLEKRHSFCWRSAACLSIGFLFNINFSRI